MEKIRYPLNIYILWHPSFIEGKKYADSFFSFFCRKVNEPLTRGIGIPVFFRTGDCPIPINFDVSEHTAIILLVNDDMVIDNNWSEYTNELVNQVKKDNKNIIYPIAFTTNAYKFNDQLKPMNYIRIYEQNDDTEIRIKFILRRIAHELCRLLYGKETVAESHMSEDKHPALKLFISHAKEDGVEFAKNLSDFMQTETELKSFYDANDIPIGYEFSEIIEANIQKSVLLVVHSDKYSSREWCRKEVILAKKYNRPIIVINLYKEGEDRSFPYMANLKNLRIDFQNENLELIYNNILLMTLEETLRFKYQKMFLFYLNKTFGIKVGNEAILSRPPELFSLLFLKDLKEKYILYPDPPLGDEELEIIKIFTQDTQFITPAILPLINNLKPENLNDKFLKSFDIGISISEVQDIFKFGFEQWHIEDVLVEFSRYLLAAGATLSYGGDVRYKTPFNFAEILFQLTRNHNKENRSPAKKIINYISYPLYTKISTKEKSDLYDVATLIEVSPPDNLEGDHNKIFDAETLHDKYVWARSLTKMRETMNEKINARLIVGGKTRGYRGKYPGLVEEAYLALKSKKPVFLIGAFGGATQCIIEALKNGKPPELTEEFQFSNNGYEDFKNYYNKEAKRLGLELINYDDLLAFFNSKGISSLNNGLNDEENEVLFKTTNFIEMISLVLKGLRNL